MKQPVFSGVCTALVTPFLNNQVNYPMAEQLIKAQIQSGVNAIALSGTTGEAPSLSDAEKIELFHRCKDFAGDTCTIIAGTGSNSTTHTIELSQAAQEAGADALLVVSPYYNKGNPDGLYSHYFAIAKSVSIPIIIYNVPSRTGMDIPVSVYKELSALSNIAGVKEASTSISKIGKIRRMCPDDFYVWAGNDDMIVPVISLGGQGVVSVISNICPAETVTMTQAALKDDYKTASSMQCALQPLIDLMFCEVNPIPVKYAMAYAGFDCGLCRLPLGQLSAENKHKIDQYFS